MLDVSPVSTLDQSTGSESGVGPRGAALWLPTAPQGWVKCREHISLYSVNVANKVPLPLPYLLGETCTTCSYIT